MAKITTLPPESTPEIEEDPTILDDNSQPEDTLSADTPFLASESKADVSLEQREKATRRGRPATVNGGPPGSAPTINNQLRVPDPKYKTYYSDSDNPNQKSKAFWNWWNQLSNPFK